MDFPTSDLPPPALVLASTSAYRRALLARLRVPFSVAPPEVDETPYPGEHPAALARRLGEAKALAVARQRPGAVVIGSDQVADLGGQPLGKPGDHERAVAQLRAMSGRVVHFHTAVTVARLGAGRPDHVSSELATVTVRFRELQDEEIERYLRLEMPYDCAGSAKSEALGIALCDSVESDDPTTLVGLPLIRVCRLLRAAGLNVLQVAA